MRVDRPRRRRRETRTGSDKERFNSDKVFVRALFGRAAVRREPWRALCRQPRLEQQRRFTYVRLLQIPSALDARRHVLERRERAFWNQDISLGGDTKPPLSRACEKAALLDTNLCQTLAAQLELEGRRVVLRAASPFRVALGFEQWLRRVSRSGPTMALTTRAVRVAFQNTVDRPNRKNSGRQTVVGDA